jgi:hypothetical protein
VIDSARGVVLASGERDAQAVDPALEPEARAEALKQRIERLLEARVGPGRAVVQVDVEADMEAQTIVERVIDPQSRIAISSEIEQSRENQSGANPGVTVASNLPDGDVEGGAGRNSRDASQTRERTNFEVSETRRERVIKPGQVRRISVAVLVDGVVAPDASGTAVWSPRPAEEMEQLRDLVQSAVGFDAARGDTVTIRSLEFTAPPEGSVAERVDEGFVDRHGALLVPARGSRGHRACARLVRPEADDAAARRPAAGRAGRAACRRGARACPCRAGGRDGPRAAAAIGHEDRPAARRLRRTQRGFGGRAAKLDRGAGAEKGDRRMTRAFRLETIAPRQEAAQARAAAEAALRATARAEGYEAGYIAGQAAATEAHVEEQSRLTAAFVEAIEDGQVTNEAARAAVLSEVGPLVARLFRALAPGVADAGWPM